MTDARLEGNEEVAARLPNPGDVVAGKYEVESQIGRGGMGVVVRACHQQLGHAVAIKFLRPEAIDDELVVERFIREARAVVAMHTEHVARVIDVGALASGVPYMIMEYLEGRDLGELLEEDGQLPIEQAVDFLLQACEAVAEAHARSLVHRDLKPANIFLTERPDGSALVKVLDFGIAKAIHEGMGTGVTALTASGTALGTPVYMSPEQVRDATDVDERTDIWSLGSVLYQMLSGAPPFEADTVPSLCAKIIADPPLALDELRSDVPAALADVVARCLKKERDARYQSVAKLALELGPFAPDRSLVSIERIVGIATRPVSRPPPGKRMSPTSTADTEAATPFPAAESDEDEAQTVERAGGAAAVVEGPTLRAERLLKTVPSSRMTRRRGRLAPMAALAVVAAVVAALGAALLWIAPWGSSAPAATEPSSTANGASDSTADTTAGLRPPVHRGAAEPPPSVTPSAKTLPGASVAKALLRTTPENATAAGSSLPKGVQPSSSSPPRQTGERIDPLEHRR